MTPTRNKKRLDTAQRKVAKARSEISTQRRALAAADAALSRVQRTHPPDDPNVAAVILRHDAAERALRSARDKERAARDDLHGALEAWLEGLGAGDLPEAQTLSTDWPILLLPARLETRFAPPEKPTELLVRIFPDEITADSFDETLSPAEAELGKSYWKAAKRGDRGAEDAWRDLVQHVPGPRASWIKAATDPSAHRDPGIRASKWARSPEARVLPDRWLVVAYRGGKAVHHAMSRAIVDPLVLWSELSRGQTDALLDLSGDGLKVDPDAAWMFQFDQALTAGMAVVFRPLVPDDLRFGFDRIIAIGVKASLAPDLAAERLASLFRAHRYSKGFALVSQGTPTNNTAEARTGFPPDDAGGAESFGLEHGSRHVSEEEDGAHLAKALGLLNRLAEDLPKVAGAHGCEQVSARVMNEALWPATGGYFLEQMLGPELGPDAINFAQTHFVEHVRGRGPLPAFRIGATPYGVLPVSSLARWKPDAARPLEGVLSTILRTLLPYWLKGVDAVPRVGRSGDAERDLLDILLMDASAREVRVRRA